MPCDTILRENQSLQQRMREVEEAINRLKQGLSSGAVKLNIGANGAVAFVNWNDRDRVSDVCAYRALSSQNSWELRKAVARAEAMQGRKVNPVAIAAGVHSHDSGKTWGGGHE